MLFDRTTVLAQGEIEEGREQSDAGVEDVERDERVGSSQVHHAGRDQRAKADAEVDQHEVDTEGTLAMLGRDESTEHGGAGSPSCATKDRDQQGRHEGLLVSVSEGPKDEGDGVGSISEQDDAQRTESVGHRAPERGAGETHDRRQGQQQRREGRREMTHVVQVDNEQ